jgi:SAM-dependent methyltransferase
MKNHKCILCECENLVTILKIDGAPINIQKLLKKNELEEDHKINLSLVRCTACNLYQLGDLSVVPEDYYEDYIMTTSFSKQINLYIEELAKTLIEKYDLNKKIIYEIGCGDGIFCEYLNKHGAQTVGIEPSAAFGKFAEEKGITVVYEYFTENLSIPKNSVDAIVSRAVFEHLKNPNEVLKAMHKFLREDGIGLIEVPSFEKAIKFDRYYDIFADHVAYYTKESLVHLVTRNNFKVLDIFDSYNNEFLVIIFKKTAPLEESRFKSEFDIYKEDFNTKVRNLISENKSISMWGAGGKGLALLSMCDFDSKSIKYIIDSDTKKIGKYSPGSHIEIFSPEKIKSDQTDVIILSAMAYEKEILKHLEDINFKGEIYVISPRLTKIRGRI